MNKAAFIVLLAASLGLVSCTSTGGPSGGILGLVSGGVLGHLIDGQSNNSSSSGFSSNGSSGSGTAGGTVVTTTNPKTGVTTQQVIGQTGNGSDDFFGNNKGAIIGALSGAASGMITDSVRKGEIQKKYDEGYAKAKSDAIKEFYWLKRDAQKAKGNGDDPPVQYRYYEVEVPAHTTSDGVFIDKHKRVIEVVE